jgi:hypothetical protein
VHYSEQIQVDVNSTDAGTAPESFALYRNFPNPFNPSTTIEYVLPARTGQEESSVSIRLSVYDMLGREVAVLVNGEQRPGVYQVHWNATGFASGAYLCRLSAGTDVRYQKMLLTK